MVSVYDEPGDNPWLEAETIFGELEKNIANSFVGYFHSVAAGGGYRTEGGNTLTDQSLRYKEVTAIGHPLAQLSKYFSSSEYFCPSEATAFMPYFSSGVDALSWRLGTLERLYLPYLLLGVRVVGERGMAQQ